ncbi:MAG: AcrR family transcriptional regulator [Cellvibrionaceae bacterium]|jgi:AcrR family transcriptional regulator
MCYLGIVMARAQFDRNDVIDKATQLFWQNGFNGSSMQDVFSATGLKPGSIYLAFGSKEALFKETLEYYSSRSLNDIKHVLDLAPSVEQGICNIFKRMLSDSSRQDYCSCFLVKSQLELASESAELHGFTVDQLKKIETLYRQYLTTVYDKSTATSRARSVMLHIFGLRVYGYMKTPQKLMLDGLTTGMPWLPWQ